MISPFAWIRRKTAEAVLGGIHDALEALAGAPDAQPALPPLPTSLALPGAARAALPEAPAPGAPPASSEPAAATETASEEEASTQGSGKGRRRSGAAA